MKSLNHSLTSQPKQSAFLPWAQSLLLAVLFFVFPPVYAQDQAPEQVDVIIELKSSVVASDSAMVSGMGGEVRRSFWIIDAMAVSVPESALQELANHPRIKSISDDSKVQLLLGQVVPWGVSRIFNNEEGLSLQAIRTASRGGEGIKVAVLDTGIDPNHPDLNVIDGWNVMIDRPRNEWHDLNGHGTHVAGIIAAKDNEFGVVGVAPNVELYAIRVAYDDGSGQPSDTIAGIQEAINQGMHIINMSFGSLEYNRDVENAVNNAYNLHNVLVVASAGNGGQLDSVHYPAKYGGAIAVAASSLTNDGDERALYSDRGPEIELIAPGTGILSTVPNVELGGQPGGPIKNYAYMSGTSMAAPHVTGVAALIWSRNPGLFNNEVRDILSDTAEDLERPADEQGAGLVRADLAIPGERFTARPLTAARVYRQFGDQSQMHTITVRYLDEEGEPVEDVEVLFEVTDGPNDGEDGDSETDSHGEASWTYSGTGGGGVDEILVTVVLDSQANPPETVELETTCHWITGWDLVELDAPEVDQAPLIGRMLNTAEDGFGGWSAHVAAQDSDGSALLWNESNYLKLLPPPQETADSIFLTALNSVPDNILTVGSAGSFPVQAWYWLPDQIEAIKLPYLSDLDPDMWGARAKATNNRGWIAGSSSDRYGDLHAVVWWPDFEYDSDWGQHLYYQDPIDLAHGSTVQQSRAEAINDNGIVVGAGKNSSGYWRAFRSTATHGVPSGWNDMGTATGFSTHESFAFDINNHGALVGTSQVSSPSGAWRAMYKSPNSGRNLGWINLGVLTSSDTASEARSINDNGLIVGHSMWPSRAFVTAAPRDDSQWANAQPMYDLNDYARVSTGAGYQNVSASEWTLLAARSVNSRNWILAMAELQDQATPRAVLLKPRYD